MLKSKEKNIYNVKNNIQKPIEKELQCCDSMNERFRNYLNMVIAHGRKTIKRKQKNHQGSSSISTGVNGGTVQNKDIDIGIVSWINLLTKSKITLIQKNTAIQLVSNNENVSEEKLQ